MSKAKALILFRSLLRLVSASSERAEIGQVECGSLRAFSASQVYDAELGLILGNVVEEGVHQALGVLRRHDDAVANLRFYDSGEGGGKVYDEFASGVGNDGQVGLGALGYFRFEFQTELILRFIIVIIHTQKIISAKLTKKPYICKLQYQR